MSSQMQDDAQLAQSPSLGDLFIQFLIIGAVSFGGGIIAYERILLVEKRKWLSADEFMAYLAISQTMPGLNSVNLAVLAGDHLRGWRGAVIATLGLIFPGSLLVLGFGMIYASAADHPSINFILAGIAAAATGLLAAITYKIGDAHWRHVKSLAIIVVTFILMSIFKLSLPYVILIMAPISLYLYRPGQTQ
ncbi:chromate transporter [Polynucleobacter sp. AP-Elch-400A-B2]|uniref:chromate transporter n=1 Tax=Polynucleobacter sp. AP-Elch-400A-B2 TaxID=2576930 RepID=UPI001BFE55FA|nr:chromate transporter [Polynucleobacter sp. AP-Elch-400A-B2]QWE25505.1 chromate transporter [Polynucleobacter sp. AP-Elch-400A-B2]